MHLSKMQKKRISYSYSLRLSWQPVLLTYINAFVKDAKKHISYSYSLRLSWQLVLLTYIIEMHSAQPWMKSSSSLNSINWLKQNILCGGYGRCSGWQQRWVSSTAEQQSWPQELSTLKELPYQDLKMKSAMDTLPVGSTNTLLLGSAEY